LRISQKFLQEVREVTKPELVFGTLIAIAGLLFKQFLGGGLTWGDATSYIVPILWVGCVAIGYYSIKAAVSVRREDILQWQSWTPTIKEAEVLRPPRPSLIALYIIMGGIELVLTAAIVLTVMVVRRHHMITSTRVSPVAPKGVEPKPTLPLPLPRATKHNNPVRTKVPSRTEAGIGLAGSGRADLKLEFVGKDRLQFMYFADSRESANEPKRFFGLWDINNPFFYENRPGIVQPLPLAFKTEMDFVFHNSRQGPMDVLDSPQAATHVRAGDFLFGIADVMCLNCDKERSYWLYFAVGTGGWYAEMDRPPWGQTIQVPRPEFNEQQRTAAIDAQVPRYKRVAIPER
jgi:hypothetical protein